MTRTSWMLGALLAALAAALAAAGCGGNDGGEPAARTAPAVAGAVPFDRSFIDAMVPHHRSAIEMAKTAKEAGLSAPELVAIADDIVVTQQEEIDRMLEWRQRWFGSRDLEPAGAAALGLSEEEAGMQHRPEDVAAADDVDAAFASMMTDHHRGAIAMARIGLERAQHEEIRGLAEAIVAAQEREIEAMADQAAEHHE